VYNSVLRLGVLRGVTSRTRAHRLGQVSAETADCGRITKPYDAEAKHLVANQGLGGLESLSRQDPPGSQDVGDTLALVFASVFSRQAKTRFCSFLAWLSTPGSRTDPECHLILGTSELFIYLESPLGHVAVVRNQQRRFMMAKAKATEVTGAAERAQRAERRVGDARLSRIGSTITWPL
jgi:hypothetical protein